MKRQYRKSPRRALDEFMGAISKIKSLDESVVQALIRAEQEAWGEHFERMERELISIRKEITALRLSKAKPVEPKEARGKREEDKLTYSQRYYRKNKERIRQQQREYYKKRRERETSGEDSREKALAKKREYMKGYWPKYYAKNKERLSARRKELYQRKKA